MNSLDTLAKATVYTGVGAVALGATAATGALSGVGVIGGCLWLAAGTACAVLTHVAGDKLKWNKIATTIAALATFIIGGALYLHCHVAITAAVVLSGKTLLIGIAAFATIALIAFIANKVLTRKGTPAAAGTSISTGGPTGGSTPSPSFGARIQHHFQEVYNYAVGLISLPSQTPSTSSSGARAVPPASPVAALVPSVAAAAPVAAAVTASSL